MLFNIRRRTWDPAMAKMLGVPMNLLPEIRPSAGKFGESVRLGALPAGVPISGVAGDQQAALFGQGCVRPGEMKVTYGTGGFLLVHAGTRPLQPRHGLLTTVACGPRGEPAYALEGAVFIAGAVMQWLRDELGLLKTSPESEKISRSVPGTGGVYIVPAFTGLGAPWWDANARGIITGLTRGSGRAQIVRAAEESIAYQVADVVTAMQKGIGKRITELRVDGGACRDSFLMQFQADILAARIVRPRNVETTVAGAAHLAGLGCGLWSPAKLAGMHAVERRFTPRMKPAVRNTLLSGWHTAVSRALTS
jgi:glycerol kinase